MTTPRDHIRAGDRVAPGRWPPPARTAADVWTGFPSWWTDHDDTVRDAIGEALRGLWLDVASAAVRMTAARLRGHARGFALDLVGLGAGLPRLDGELDRDYRPRIAVVEDAVSPEALQAAATVALPGTVVTESWRSALYAGRSFLGRRNVDPVATRLAGRTPWLAGSLQVLTGVPVRVSDESPEIWIVLPYRSRGLLAAWSVAEGATLAAVDPRASFVGVVFGRNVPALASSATSRGARAVAEQINRLRATGTRWLAFIST